MALKTTLLISGEERPFARLITWHDEANSVTRGAVEPQYSTSSHTILMSTPDTHACAHFGKYVRAHTHTLRTQC